ncbi:MAG: hypothetical protein CVU27_07980 [Betaproteobacteria bacterium HGW-Betaproteobacteria-20]|nr:MAG: hypothetical protein CVU27_07980 [Betaproteobacteria bacterium HGW-Betaproteobacteria-20]
MEKSVEILSKKIWDELSIAEREGIAAMLQPMDSVRDVNEEYVEQRTFGQRAADGVAKMAGSWSFILLFLASLLMWAFLNTEILGPRHKAFDPYPYVFLNLVLSMLAAVQAPIIMMSQNRQNARDRLDAEIDHEVNVRAEVAIQSVDERIQMLAQKLDESTRLLLTHKQIGT